MEVNSAFAAVRISGRRLPWMVVNIGSSPRLEALEDTAGYRRVPIHHGPEEEVHKVIWTASAASVLHGHAGSVSVCTVISGRLEEERFLPERGGFRYEKVTLNPGEQSSLPKGAYHRVKALEDAVTIHCYWPAPPTTAEHVSPEAAQKLSAAIRKHRQTERQMPAARIRSKNLLDEIERLLPAWAERETLANAEGKRSMPLDTLREMRDSGILAAPIPLEDGGWGATLHETAQVVRRIGQVAPSAALALVMPLGNAATARIPAEAIPAHLRPALGAGKRWIIEKVLAGNILAVANSEPGSGGELKHTRTTARLAEDGTYHLTGKKSFATFGADADYFLCAARRQPLTGEREEVVDGFFVARDALGMTVDSNWNPVGMRTTASVGLALEDAPAEALLGFPGCLEGISARHWSTVLFAAVFLGVGEGALAQGQQQVRGEAIWSKASLAESRLALDAGAGYLSAVASDERWPLPADAREQTRRLKTYVARTAAQTALQMAMISGGRCYTPQHPVFRFLCDALAGPLLRPPVPAAMDAIVQEFAPAAVPIARAA